MRTATSYANLQLDRLGHQLLLLARQNFPNDQPTIDEAYGFLLKNSDIFGYEYWPADMPASAPSALAVAYGPTGEASRLEIHGVRFFLIQYGRAVTAAVLPHHKTLADAVHDFIAHHVTGCVPDAPPCLAWLIENGKAVEHMKFRLEVVR